MEYSGISIIIPAYNEEKYLGKTLEQFRPYRDRFNLEIVVSDDLSTDLTVETARPLSDRVVLNPGGNRGRSGALNRGVRAASHDIFIFIDADIIFRSPETFYPEVYRVFAGDPEMSGGMTDHWVYPEEETRSDYLAHLIWNGVMRMCARFNFWLSTPGFQMGRRPWFERIGGYDENMRVIQDVEYSLRLARAAKFHYFKTGILESPRRYRDEGYLIFTYRSTLRWLNLLFRHRPYGSYKIVR